jgi:MFS family permease
MIGMTASAIAYVIFAYSNSLWLLFLSRLVQGSGGGTVSVIQAYVADAVAPEQRAKGLGWLSASTNAGVALGPVFGGQALRLWGSHGPGLAAAVLCLINIAFAFHFLAESRDMVEAKSSVHVPGRSARAVLRVVTHSNDAAPRLIWIYAIGIGAFQGLNAILALFLAVRFGVTQNTIQYYYFYIGVISMLTRAFLLGRAVDRFGEARLSRLGQTLLALGLATMPLMHRLSDPASVAAHLGGLPVAVVAVLPFVPLALSVALLPLGTAFTFPCVTALLSRVIPSNERGLYMGVQQTFGGVARVLFPPMLGWLFDRHTNLPFFVSATLVAGTILLGLGMEEYTRPKREPQAAPAA